MSVRYEVILTCDATNCDAFECFSEGVGDEPKHAAATAGWRYTPAGRCLCELHARREWPGTFPSRPAPEPTDEELLA